MCEWGHADPAKWAGSMALANSWRTGNDLMPLYPLFADTAEGNSRWWEHAQPGQFNDPDSLAMGFLFGPNAPLLGNQLTMAESRLYFGLWVMMKSPLILSINFAQDGKMGIAWPRWLLDIVTNKEVARVSTVHPTSSMVAREGACLEH